MRGVLLPEYAPKSVANFVELCKANFFDGLCFHRIIPGFMVQGGGMRWDSTAKPPFGNPLKEKPWYKNIPGEFPFNGHPNTLRHTRGVLSMARSEIMNSASSQFFICVDDAPSLDGKYAAFGTLTDDESIQVAIDLSLVPTKKVSGHTDVPVDPIIIKTINIVEVPQEYIPQDNYAQDPYQQEGQYQEAYQQPYEAQPVYQEPAPQQAPPEPDYQESAPAEAPLSAAEKARQRLAEAKAKRATPPQSEPAPQPEPEVIETNTDNLSPAEKAKLKLAEAKAKMAAARNKE